MQKSHTFWGLFGAFAHPRYDIIELEDRARQNASCSRTKSLVQLKHAHI